MSVQLAGAPEFRREGQLLIMISADVYPVGTVIAMTNGKAREHVQFRKEGCSIDPEPWWHEGQQKAQG